MFIILFLTIAPVFSSEDSTKNYEDEISDLEWTHVDIPEDELRAPVLKEGEKSPEEIAAAYQGDIILTEDQKKNMTAH